ncbi:hypothetical protein D516_1276 [Rhodobacter sp. AKP1]|nr:hypothetical protein D516_1276 [Rhodobacter sp. AKP1]
MPFAQQHHAQRLRGLRGRGQGARRCRRAARPDLGQGIGECWQGRALSLDTEPSSRGIKRS